MEMVLAKIIAPTSRNPMDVEIWKRLRRGHPLEGKLLKVDMEDGTIRDALIVSIERIVGMFEEHELEKVFKLPLETIQQAKLFSFPAECFLILSEKGDAIG